MSGDQDGADGDHWARTKRVSVLAARLAHEINSPLAVVLANLDFLEEACAAGDLEKVELCLREARAAAQRIQAVMGTLSAVHGGPRVRHPEPSVGSRPEGQTSAGAVLVIDDEPGMAHVVERMLRGYRVVTLSDPKEALARFTNGERFDVVLCDLMMPELTGAALYQKLAALDLAQARRMIFITGGALTSATTQFLAQIQQPVLGKPFTPAELREKVEEILRT